MNTEENDTSVTLIKVLIVFMFVFPVVHYSITQNEAQKEEIINTPPKPKIFKRQPTCTLTPLIYRSQILDVCHQLIIRKTQCTPEDVSDLEKHKIPEKAPKTDNQEPRSTIVSFFATGLLISSLIAALLELYKAKNQQSKQTPTKPAMGGRKCSLADLTVLKHNRKELVRRESILEIAEDKLLVFRPAPLLRRCSFPIPSIHDNCGLMPERRFSTADRRCSIVDSGSRKTSIDGSLRRISIESDVEKRHRSRLVRH